MISRIQEAFASKAYVGYLTAGHTGKRRFVDACLALVDGGVDLLEVGIPFTDPIADGPVIQKAMDRSLSEGATPWIVLEMIQQVRAQTRVPILLFSYYNPIFTLGQTFLTKAKQSGADGILVVDLPVEEAGPFLQKVQKADLDPVFVAAPSTSVSRIRALDKVSRGFIYYACRKGTTGMRKGLPEDFSLKIQEIKQEASLPVAAGFGISSRETASEVIKHADGFVVGSAFVKALDEGISMRGLRSLAKAIDPRPL